MGKSKFISRLLEGFKLASQLTWAAFEQGQWINLGKLAPGKKMPLTRPGSSSKNFTVANIVSWWCILTTWTDER